MKRLVTMRAALADPNLLGGVLDGDSWSAWKTLLIALNGEELIVEERLTFTALTGREHEPGAPCEEFWAVIGRRGGKTRAMSALALFIAALCEHDLAAGEKGLIPILAASRQQANVAFQYISALFARPPFDRLKVAETAESISLSNNVEIQVRPASFRTIRGISAVAVIADELAFWHSDDSVNPDAEILNAVRPALATTHGPLIVISSPHARRGELWETHRKHYGPEGDPLILVAQGASRTLNPTLPQKVIDRAVERDPARAQAEYFAQFRSDVEALVPAEIVDACISRGVYERPFMSGVRYVAFADPSGGSADSFTIAVAHKDPRSEVAVLDAVREVRPPFSPEQVTAEFADLLKTYGLRSVTGDRYAGTWPSERFHVHGISYLPSEKTKSEIYGALLPLLNSRRCDLLDVPRLEAQLCGLERRTSRGGRDSIDHGPSGGHDDVANAVGGALVLASARNRMPVAFSGTFTTGPADPFFSSPLSVPFGGDNNQRQWRF